MILVYCMQAREASTVRTKRRAKQNNESKYQHKLPPATRLTPYLKSSTSTNVMTATTPTNMRALTSEPLNF
jgi:hypothetical protein